MCNPRSSLHIDYLNGSVLILSLLQQFGFASINVMLKQFVRIHSNHAFNDFFISSDILFETSSSAQIKINSIEVSWPSSDMRMHFSGMVDITDT